MPHLHISADQLISALLSISESETVCILDSSGVGHLDSHLLIAGIDPVEVLEISNDDPTVILELLDEELNSDLASIFTVSYNFGEKLIGIHRPTEEFSPSLEPDAFIASFDVLVVHDYATGKTKLTGNADKFSAIETKLIGSICNFRYEISNIENRVISNFTKPEYLAAIETIKERIRCGDTYQTNLTQQLQVALADDLTPQMVFNRLRQQHPAPFASLITRLDSAVISASPERFFRIEESESPRVSKGETPDAASIALAHARAFATERRQITTSPIKGTRPRGNTSEEDTALRNELLTSPKDCAENTMIVDLLRNDLGRVCEYGSVRVEKLCDLEEHPTLFHLVSTVSGELRSDVKFSDILNALFPCGSITGAPKISTMRIIDEIETVDRGLSMGAIGYYVPGLKSNVQSSLAWDIGPATLDLSVAIRTMVIRDKIATFNVGGGIVIDSEPEKEYDESLLKAKALLTALGNKS